MKLNELLFELSVGELSSLAMSNDGDGTIRKKDLNRVIVAVNGGIRDLYNKFFPTVDVEITTTEEDVTEYALPIESLYVHSVTANGHQLPINDEELPRSVHVINQKTLKVPVFSEGTVLEITYQPKPPTICLEGMEEEVALPEVLIQPLKLFVAFTIFTNIGSTDSNSKAQTFAQQYQAMCAQLLGSNILNNNRYTNQRFDLGGWGGQYSTLDKIWGDM